MSKLTARYQWGVIIGFYLVVRVLRGVAKANESLQPFLVPLIIVLALVAFSTWVITPVSNLFLRFNKYGRLLLDKQEKNSANFVAACFGVFIAGLALYVSFSDVLFLAVAAFGFMMMVPCGTMFSPTQYKNVLPIYAAGMASVGLCAVARTFATGELFNPLSLVFIIGFAAFQWVANFLLIKEDNP
jgi:hypothetical protein